VDVVIRGDPAQDDPAGQDGSRGQLRGEPDQDRPLLLGNKSRGAQACGEVSRLVVGAGLPPDGFAAPGEVVPLPGRSAGRALLLSPRCHAGRRCSRGARRRLAAAARPART
jgi:hypothetical protein